LVTTESHYSSLLPLCCHHFVSWGKSWVVVFWWVAYRTQLGLAAHALQTLQLASQERAFDTRLFSRRAGGDALASLHARRLLSAPLESTAFASPLIFKQRAGVPNHVVRTDPRLLSFVREGHLAGNKVQGEHVIPQPRSYDDADDGVFI
jgi:hypothetical protein